MAAQQIVPGLYQIPLGVVNCFYIDDPDGGVLIDTGFPGNAEKILGALRELGKQPSDIKHLLLTHTHADHIGNAAAIRKATGARTYMHPLDAPITEAGTGFRAMQPAPGLLNRILTGFVHFRINTMKMKVEPCIIDERVEEGVLLPVAGGIFAKHTPGHCAGQLCFLWKKQGVLFAADSCGNVKGLDYSIAYEDIELGRRTLRSLCELQFETAVFGHGKPIPQNAAAQFRAKWLGGA